MEFIKRNIIARKKNKTNNNNETQAYATQTIQSSCYWTLSFLGFLFLSLQQKNSDDIYTYHFFFFVLCQVVLRDKMAVWNGVSIFFFSASVYSDRSHWIIIFFFTVVRHPWMTMDIVKPENKERKRKMCSPWNRDTVLHFVFYGLHFEAAHFCSFRSALMNYCMERE